MPLPTVVSAAVLRSLPCQSLPLGTTLPYPVSSEKTQLIAERVALVEHVEHDRRRSCQTPLLLGSRKL